MMIPYPGPSACERLEDNDPFTTPLIFLYFQIFELFVQSWINFDIHLSQFHMVSDRKV